MKEENLLTCGRRDEVISHRVSERGMSCTQARQISVSSRTCLLDAYDLYDLLELALDSTDRIDPEEMGSSRLALVSRLVLGSRDA
jgi:hypothetical protein